MRQSPEDVYCLFEACGSAAPIIVRASGHARRISGNPIDNENCLRFESRLKPNPRALLAAFRRWEATFAA